MIACSTKSAVAEPGCGRPSETVARKLVAAASSGVFGSAVVVIVRRSAARPGSIRIGTVA